MCDKTKKEIDVATLLYKIFLGVMFGAQLYDVFFSLVGFWGLGIHLVLGIYLIFRYYLLVKMKKRAIALDLTLTEFLNERSTCRSCSDGLSCPKCGCCECS
jgi:hypothetical protein